MASSRPTIRESPSGCIVLKPPSGKAILGRPSGPPVHRSGGGRDCTGSARSPRCDILRLGHLRCGDVAEAQCRINLWSGNRTSAKTVLPAVLRSARGLRPSTSARPRLYTSTRFAVCCGVGKTSGRSSSSVGAQRRKNPVPAQRDAAQPIDLHFSHAKRSASIVRSWGIRG